MRPIERVDTIESQDLVLLIAHSKQLQQPVQPIKVLDLPQPDDLAKLVAHIQKHGHLPSGYVILKFRAETTAETLARLEEETYCAMFL